MKDKNEQWVVMVEEGVYISNSSGGFVTANVRYAHRFKTISQATHALARARKHDNFETAQIYTL